MRGRIALWAILALALCWEGALAQQARRPFLFLSQERLLTGSAAGQALLAQEEEKRKSLVAEARALDAAFEAEEKDITARRDEMAPEEFRALADDFDARAVAARRQQLERSETLAKEFERERRAFYAAIAPLLVDMMARYGALAIFDEANVLLSDQSVNITDAVIAEIDKGAVPDLAVPDENGDQP